MNFWNIETATRVHGVSLAFIICNLPFLNLNEYTWKYLTSLHNDDQFRIKPLCAMFCPSFLIPTNVRKMCYTAQIKMLSVFFYWKSIQLDINKMTQLAQNTDNIRRLTLKMTFVTSAKVGNKCVTWAQAR